jgi:hypothetical protein
LYFVLGSDPRFASFIAGSFFLPISVRFADAQGALLPFDWRECGFARSPKPNSHAGGNALVDQSTVELLRQEGNDPRSEALRLLVFFQAHTIVGDRQFDRVLYCKIDLDETRASVRKCIFQSVRNQFIGYEPDRKSDLVRQIQSITARHFKGDRAGFHQRVSFSTVSCRKSRISTGRVSSRREMIIDLRHDLNAPRGAFQCRSYGWFAATCLQAHHRAQNGKIVFVRCRIS